MLIFNEPKKTFNKKLFYVYLLKLKKLKLFSLIWLIIKLKVYLSYKLKKKT